jgi:tyrosinase
MANESVPEMVGATDGAIHLGVGPTSASLRLEPPSGPAAQAFAFGEDAAESPAVATPRLYLKVENVRAAEPSTNYDVFLNLPEGADPAQDKEHLAGVMSTFGIARASDRDDEHGGSGLNVAFEITELVGRLRAKGALDPSSLAVTFVPRPAEADLPTVTVGRVSVYSTVSRPETSSWRHILAEKVGQFVSARTRSKQTSA